MGFIVRQVTSKFVVLTHYAALFAMIGLIPACGGAQEKVKIKDYRLALVQRVLSLETEFQRLIKDFNRYAKSSVLIYENSPENANSALIVTKNLKEKTAGKIGLGQWITHTDIKSSFSGGFQSARMETIRYSMRLEFDDEYIRTRSGSNRPEDRYELQKLFFHEVGHGLEMDHDNDPRSVMYSDIIGEKDFEAFFEKVRAYMNDLE